MMKPKEIMNFCFTLAEVDETVAPDRRSFLKEVGLAVLTVQCLPLIACSAATPGINDMDARNNLIIQSGPGAFHHVHDLLVPFALLKAPPLQGIKLTTTQAMYHRHNIVLTQKQLIAVNQGETVTQKASSHLFVIALANGQRHSSV